MPVSLCEWRVRIGTFVHWIRDYEIKERKERLLKERIRRMKILFERLKAKMDDSEQDPEGDDKGESREDGLSSMKRKQCPHKTTNIQSSGDSYIKDLLTSCDQCIHDLLTTSHCCSTNLPTPADGCIRKLLKPCDNSVKDMITPDYRSVKDLLRSEDYNVKDPITPEDCSVKDLITPDVQSVKDLLVPDYRSVKDVITSEDCSIKDLITPEDCSIKDFITSEDCSVKDLITLEDCSVKDLITPEHCSVKDVITPEDCSVKDLIMPEGCSVRDLIIPEDCSVKDLITIKDCSVKDLITPEDCSVNDLITLEDCRVKDLITPEDCSIKDLITPEDCSVKDNITPEDCSVKDLIMPEDCSVKDLIALEDCRVKDLITPEHDRVKYLISPDNSQVKGVFGQNVPEFNFSRALSQIRPCSKKLKKSNDKSVNVLHTATDENIELVTPFVESNGESVTESCSRHHHALSDTSFKEHLSTKKSLTCNKLNNIVNAGVNSYSSEKQSLSQCSVKEQLTSPCLETHIGLSPRLKQSDHLSVGFLESAVSVGEDLLQLPDLCIHKPLRSGDWLINDNRKTCEPYTSGKEQHPGPDTFTNERPIRINAVFEDLVSSESYKQFQTSTDTPVEGKSSVMVPHSSRLYCNSKHHGKAKPNGTSTSLCPGPSLKSETSLIPEEIPPVAELLLLRSGDVELNPGPGQGPRWSLDLERELKSLVDEISPECYTVLCNRLGFGRAQSKSILSKNLLDVSESLFEIICSWGVKQRDGTNYKEVLADKLRSVSLDALGRKLLQGGYRMTEPPAPADLGQQDTSQSLINMTEEQLIKCGEDLKTFYLEEICKIKTDPLDFNSVLEFERIYTNLTLLKSNTPLDYAELLTTEVNGILPKRLMVEGEGGVGKTTLCSKIAWDWAKGSSQFERFSWILVIPLREVVKGQTVGDIVKNYLSDSNSVTPAQIDNYIRSQPTKVLIVLDGLDEYDGDLFSEEGYDISQILRRKKFKECTVLVTTRPWRADQIKCNKDLRRSYAFIAVKGFSPENVSSYIRKYFVSDQNAGSELIRFIEVNDVIKENMAPFPIYVAMLCILWENSDFEKREKIRRLKTFSQLFDQMVMFLKDHYASKNPEILRDGKLEEEMENINSCLLEIGSIAFQGLLTKKLTFTEKDFISCKKAMETCCRVGVLSRENQNISRWKRTSNTRSSVTTSVFFPHKLFQEYIAALHLDFLFNTDREAYNNLLDKVIGGDAQEFRYLLYFTAAQGQEIGLDIVKQLQQNKARRDYGNPFLRHNDFLVDVTFEAYNRDTAKSVGQRIFAEEKILTIDKDMSAHTMSGYLFIMEQHGMETLIFRGRSCGPTVSRDLADFLSSSSSLSRLEFHRTTLDEDFYRLLQDRASSPLAELHVDNQFLDELHGFQVTIRDLFPSLKQLGLTTLQTVTPGFVERLAHECCPSVLSIESGPFPSDGHLKEGDEYPVPLIGKPSSLGQLFSSSFPQLTSLSFKGLVIGNKRCEAILRSLRNHEHMKSISFFSCCTDDELDLLARQISKENGIAITLDHDLEQTKLTCELITADLMDALCHRTCIRELYVYQIPGSRVRRREWFSEFQGIEVDSKIQTFRVVFLKLRDDQSASCCLGRLICLLPCLTDLTIERCSFHDAFYKEIADRSSSSKIQAFDVSLLELHDDQSASCCLRKFICLLPCLTNLTIYKCFFHDEFYKEIADRASSSKIQTFTVRSMQLQDDQSASCCLGKFICLLPCLTDLTIERSFHDKFYKEIADHASCSKIQTFVLSLQELHNDQSASCSLGRFICLLPCLTDLMIWECSFHDALYKEIADHASSSKIQTFTAAWMKLNDDQSASCCQGKFICLLPCLTHLTISLCSFHDEFYKEIADRASSSKIQTLKVRSLEQHDDQSASCSLGKFICLLPCLTDLRIEGHSFHDKFYKEIADLASPCKIQTLVMSFCYGRDNVIGQSGSKQLARFLCSLPCLTDLTLKGYDLHDDFYTELTSLAASSQNPYFRNKKHMGMLEEWSERKDRCQQQQLNQHHQAVIPAYQHNPRSWEQLGPNILQPRQSAQPSVQYQNDHQRPIQSEHQEAHQFRNTHESRSFQLQLGSCSSHPWQLPQHGLHCHNDLQRGRQAEPQQVPNWIAPDNPHQSRSLDRLDEQGPYLLQSQRPAQLSTQYRDDQQRNMYLQPTQSHVIINPAQRQSGPVEDIWSSYHLRLAQPPMQYQDIDERDIQSQLPQSNQFMNPTQQHHLRFLEEQRPYYVPQPQYPVQLSVPYHDSHQRRSHSLTSKELSAGMTQLHVYDSDRDRPSTSGLKSADISRAASVGSQGKSVHVGKRSHSDSDSDNGTVSTSESKKRRSGKRRTKTDRNPDSP